MVRLLDAKRDAELLRAARVQHRLQEFLSPSLVLDNIATGHAIIGDVEPHAHLPHTVTKTDPWTGYKKKGAPQATPPACA